jgi:hypothetical protein
MEFVLANMVQILANAAYTYSIMNFNAIEHIFGFNGFNWDYSTVLFFVACQTYCRTFWNFASMQFPIAVLNSLVKS